MEESKHKAWLTFVRKALDVPLGFSVDDLRTFRAVASRHSPSLIPLVEAYYRLAKSSETSVGASKVAASLKKSRGRQMHIFDLLREKKFFPTNADLANFAARVMPHMRTYRFDKMSRGDIAARVIEFIEQSDPRARNALEESMREALEALKHKRTRPAVDADRRSFLSKWEKIIKGLEI